VSRARAERPGPNTPSGAVCLLFGGCRHARSADLELGLAAVLVGVMVILTTILVPLIG
jgi:hypothetical protein